MRVLGSIYSPSWGETRGKMLPIEKVCKVKVNEGLCLSDGPLAAATSVRDHFCDYATGLRLLAANHKNDTDRYVQQ